MGTHGIHVTSGLVWIIVMMVLVAKKGLTERNRTRLMPEPVLALPRRGVDLRLHRGLSDGVM